MNSIITNIISAVGVVGGWEAIRYLLNRKTNQRMEETKADSLEFTLMKKSKLPRGLRNNNPGNIRLGSNRWVGEIRPSQDKEFCQFRSMKHGYRALIITKMLLTRERMLSMIKFLSLWCGSDDLTLLVDGFQSFGLTDTFSEKLTLSRPM